MSSIDSTNSGQIDGEHTIELIAGQHPNGELIIERVLVTPHEQENSFKLLKSPVFVRGIACGDVVEQMENPKGAFKILQHSGNLCIRVLSQVDLDEIEQSLTVELAKLGGDIDIKEDRVLVYSIHVSCGFQETEKILNKYVQQPDAAWFYGNVYDPESGEPLNWWDSILQPE